MAKFTDQITVKVTFDQHTAYLESEELAENARQTFRGMLSKSEDAIASAPIFPTYSEKTGLAKAGISEVVDDYKHVDFGHLFELEGNVTLRAQSLDFFSELHSHGSRLLRRAFREERDTTVLLVGDGYGLDDTNDRFENFLLLAGAVLDEPKVPIRSNFNVVSYKPPLGTWRPQFFISTESEIAITAAQPFNLFDTSHCLIHRKTDRHSRWYSHRSTIEAVVRQSEPLLSYRPS